MITAHAANNKPRVLMVCTRDIRKDATAGRERTLAFIHSSLLTYGETRIIRVTSMFEAGSLPRLIRICYSALIGLLQARPVPLQCLLFFDYQYIEQLRAAIDEFRPDTVYFDGVRSGLYAPLLRKAYPELRFVCDFDDLMSHRMDVLAETRQPLSLGYLNRVAAPWLQRLLRYAPSFLFVLYERRALLEVEAEIAACCEQVVLVSLFDGERLRQQAPVATVVVIPPALPPMRGFLKGLPISRFVFVGSDSLIQNRMTIEYLVDLWNKVRPLTSLHIFGKQQNAYPLVPGVIFEGFVDNIADAYAPGSVMLAPSFFRGGVKTKVLEAMTFGIVPVGTNITFEGIQAECSKLILSEEEIRDLILNPDNWTLRLLNEGARAIQQVAEFHAPERVAQAWISAVWPAAASVPETGGP